MYACFIRVKSSIDSSDECLWPEVQGVGVILSKGSCSDAASLVLHLAAPLRGGSCDHGAQLSDRV